MTLFELVKQNICVPDAAEHYGLQVSRNGMCSCPFHEDRHPSMKLNERYYYCFGCGATGDVIDLVARLFGLSSFEAVQKLAQDFGIDPDKPPAAAALPKPERPLLKAYRQEEVRCLRVLCDYLHLLESWKVQYAPKTPEDALDDRFVELLAVSSTVGAAQITAEDSTAATITSPDGILSIEMPGDEWKEKEDSDFWFEITDGNNSIVIDHLSNGEMLPDIKMAGEENEEVSG